MVLQVADSDRHRIVHDIRVVKGDGILFEVAKDRVESCLEFINGRIVSVECTFTEGKRLASIMMDMTEQRGGFRIGEPAWDSFPDGTPRS